MNIIAKVTSSTKNRCKFACNIFRVVRDWCFVNTYVFV